MGRRRVRSIQAELLAKSKEAALNAVQIYNNPLVKFKCESFVVMMVIAWTYLLHAYYRRQRIEYRYFKQGRNRRKFDKTRSGEFKYWELERCLNDDKCPLDGATKHNLRFLVGLRHRVEHQMVLGLDAYVGSRYQACCLNYEYYVTTLFGPAHSVASSLALALQFRDISLALEGKEIPASIPARLANYITTFDASIGEDFHSPRYACRYFFSRRLAGKVGQADRVVEFIPSSSPLAEQINKEYWVLKEVERPKFGAKVIVYMMKNEGFVRFNLHHHTGLWKAKDAKNPAKGYGAEVCGQWFWYERWINEVRAHCEKNAELYRGE